MQNDDYYGGETETTKQKINRILAKLRGQTPQNVSHNGAQNSSVSQEDYGAGDYGAGDYNSYQGGGVRRKARAKSPSRRRTKKRKSVLKKRSGRKTRTGRSKSRSGTKKRTSKKQRTGGSSADIF